MKHTAKPQRGDYSKASWRSNDQAERQPYDTQNDNPSLIGGP